ncbi:MAG: electron transport complex subunit RsxE [Eubacterium sp.]|nr:electron transport complex subunit RsxE [Eubacterium sp.]
MNKYSPVERLLNGLFRENPTLVLTLGMCPTLAVTTSAINGLGMGLTTTAVLMFSNMIISLLRNFIPDRVRIPGYIVVIASLVTVVQFVLQAYVPTLNDALGVYIPLIVVNCIILGRAESFAGKNGPINSFFDGLGMGLGFTMALTILGALRELLGAGTFFNLTVLPESIYTPITIFILAPGAFLVLSCMVAVQNKIKNHTPKAAAEAGESVQETETAESAQVEEDAQQTAVEETAKTAETAKAEETGDSKAEAKKEDQKEAVSSDKAEESKEAKTEGKTAESKAADHREKEGEKA